ncbi:MAG: TonB-dependent receptor [Bacteroidetes bacterium]|nr:MAG: TonB-dependent receptor [Bacteroidota bacterium]
MIKQIIVIPVFILFSLLPAGAQVKKQEAGLKREVTLYNPYKPSLPESKKRSFLPEMNDTMKVSPSFRYDIRTEPFLPAYTISPIKAAALLPDPLPKLYKSYVNIGMGNYITPLAEISITNERSKKGTLGFYARHFSSSGKVELQNSKKVFAGYMDNDASLFGRKFFKRSLFEGSLDFAQKTRYAYGYNPAYTGYSPERKDIKMNYDNIGAKASLASLTLDSTNFSYNFDLYYNYFYNTNNLFQHSAGFTGIMAKSYKGFYVGSGISYDYFSPLDFISASSKYIASISPFIKKSTEQWNFKLGIQALLDKNLTATPVFHIYPDFNFSFSVVPSYIGFFAGLSGKLEKNDPLKIISENPFLLKDGRLFSLPNTDHALVVSAGLKGNTGIEGNYLVSASYSVINDMLFYFNFVSLPEVGNNFVALSDDVELLKIHGEISGKISDKISYNGVASWYKYTLATNEYAWNKPDWDARIGIKYNLRDKIIAGAELTGIGKRKLHVSDLFPIDFLSFGYFQTPVHINLNLSAEYRYSKILSFWTKFNNISNNRYYEWAYYPSQRFQFMLGFTYSL